MKFFKQALKYGSPAALFAATSAHAALDLTPMTSAFTASDIVVAILAIGATLAVVYVAQKAANIVLGMLRGR
jgi:hypothetical protein